MNLYKLMLPVVTLSLCLDKLRPPRKEVSLMSHSIGSQLSDEDAQLIELNQLGSLLDIYRLKPGYISFLYGGGLCFIVVGVVMLIFIITRIAIGFPSTDPNAYLEAVPLIIALLGVLLFGLITLGIALPEARSERVLLCEHGLLQVKKHLRSTQVEAAHWNDIRAIKRDGFRSYYIVQQGKGALTLTLYQNIDELVELIKQRSREG